MDIDCKLQESREEIREARGHFKDEVKFELNLEQ